MGKYLQGSGIPFQVSRSLKQLEILVCLEEDVRVFPERKPNTTTICQKAWIAQHCLHLKWRTSSLQIITGTFSGGWFYVPRWGQNQALEVDLARWLLNMVLRKWQATFPWKLTALMGSFWTCPCSDFIWSSCRHWITVPLSSSTDLPEQAAGDAGKGWTILHSLPQV